MKKTIIILDKIIKSIALIIVIFVVSVLLIGAMPRTKKNYSLEHENSISEYYEAKDVQKIISPNNDIRFIVFLDEIEKDKLIVTIFFLDNIPKSELLPRENLR